jgi:hypothetical protein
VIAQEFPALAVDPTGTTLYAATPASSNGSAQLVKIDLATAAVTTLLTPPAPAQQRVVSPDGVYLCAYLLYGATVMSQQIVRPPIATMAIDQTVPLTSSLLGAGRRHAAAAGLRRPGGLQPGWRLPAGRRPAP